MLHQYLIRNESKEVTHAVWVMPARTNNMYMLATNLPMAFLHQFFEKRDSNNLFSKEDSHRTLCEFIRFFERIEFLKYGYPTWLTRSIRTNVKLVQHLRNIWFNVPDFEIATPTINSLEYYFLRTDFESMMHFCLCPPTY